MRDQDAVFHLAAVLERLTTDLAGAAVAATQPYEGGHPDHDAAALAVRRAADRLGIPVVEFACYCPFHGERVFGRFWPDASSPEQRRAILSDEAERIEAALAAHRSQVSVFGAWRPAVERWRARPAYDFTAPPLPSAVLYDSFGWALTSARWREAAARELQPC